MDDGTHRVEITWTPAQSCTPPDCSDGNPCTDDSCNGATGVCEHTNNSNSCNDGLYCNGADTCSGGSCLVHAGDPCAPTRICCEGTNTCADECCDDPTCDDADPCTGVGTCVAGLCHPTFTADCNTNSQEDWCDITEGTSDDCNANVIPDECEVGPVPAELQLDNSEPKHDESLWRTEKNFALLKFACAVTAPPAGAVEVRELLPDGAFGSDLAGSFSFTIDDPGTGDRTLRVTETTAVLNHRTWYGILSAGWSGVAPFEIHYVVQVGDANNDGRVLGADFSLVNAGIACFNCPDDRRDINGDHRILGADASLVNAHIASFNVPKPSGH